VAAHEPGGVRGGTAGRVTYEILIHSPPPAASGPSGVSACIAPTLAGNSVVRYLQPVGSGATCTTGVALTTIWQQ
jgi:hypothetical protein